MKALTALILAGLSLPAGSLAIKEAAPTLREMVYHMEANVSTMEIWHYSGAAEARAEWEPKKALALDKISALEALADSILLQDPQTETQLPDSYFQ